MDIRLFFNKIKSDLLSEPLTSQNSSVSEQDSSDPECSTSINMLPTLACVCEINSTQNECESYPDLGFYVNKSNLSDELIYKLLIKPYIPFDIYNFTNDSIAQKMNFKIE